MDIDEENRDATPTAPSAVAAVDTTVQSVQPNIPPVTAPAVVPHINSMAAMPPPPPPPVIRPLAPLPVRPPVFAPPSTQNADGGDSDSDSDDEAQAGSTAHYEISEESRQVRERQEKAMQDLMMKRRAAALAVPTNDKAVRARLRRLGEPITLFGEREMERRDRLRMIMAKLDNEGQLDKLMKAHEDEEAAASVVAEDVDEAMLQYPFFTEGPNALLNARIHIADYSIARAALRLRRSRRKGEDPDEDIDAEVDWALRQAESLALDCSEIGDDRPLAGCSFSSDGKLLATWYVTVHS